MEETAATVHPLPDRAADDGKIGRVAQLVAQSDTIEVLVDRDLIDLAKAEGARRWPGLPLTGAFPWVASVLTLEGVDLARREFDDHRHISHLPGTRDWSPKKGAKNGRNVSIYPAVVEAADSVGRAQWPGIDRVRALAVNYCLKAGIHQSSKRKPTVDPAVIALTAIV